MAAVCRLPWEARWKGLGGMQKALGHSCSPRHHPGAALLSPHLLLHRGNDAISQTVTSHPTKTQAHWGENPSSLVETTGQGPRAGDGLTLPSCCRQGRAPCSLAVPQGCSMKNHSPGGHRARGQVGWLQRSPRCCRRDLGASAGGPRWPLGGPVCDRRGEACSCAGGHIFSVLCCPSKQMSQDADNNVFMRL